MSADHLGQIGFRSAHKHMQSSPLFFFLCVSFAIFDSFYQLVTLSPFYLTLGAICELTHTHIHTVVHVRSDNGSCEQWMHIEQHSWRAIVVERSANSLSLGHPRIPLIPFSLSLSLTYTLWPSLSHLAKLTIQKEVNKEKETSSCDFFLFFSVFCLTSYVHLCSWVFSAQGRS